MAEGMLYKVDMRLRPSGRQGPVATALAGFRRYQAEEAWTWEHLALTRARVVAGPPRVGARVAAAIAETLARPHDPDKVLARRARHAPPPRRGERDRRAPNPWEFKLGPGRMMDIELLAQTGALLARPRRRAPAARRCSTGSARTGWLDRADGDAADRPPRAGSRRSSRSRGSRATTRSTRPRAARPSSG